MAPHWAVGIALVALLSATWPLVVVAGEPPANDRCDAATAITEFPHTETQSTTAATTDAGDPTPSCPISSPNPRGKSVWFEVTAPAAGTLVVDTFDSDYDTILSAYTGPCEALQPVPDACSDDDPLDGAQSRIFLPVSAGATYRLMVSAFFDDGGALQVHLAHRPPADREGDANCDERISAADITAAIIFLGDETRSPCGGDDANADGVLDAADVDAIVSAIFAGE